MLFRVPYLFIILINTTTKYQFIFYNLNTLKYYVIEIYSFQLSWIETVEVERDERQTERGKQKREQNAETESRAESRSRRGDAETRGRGDAEAKTLQNRQSLLLKSENEKRVGTHWEARCYLEKSLVTRTQPRKGAHLAPVTPLIRAANARDCTTRTHTQPRLALTRRSAACSARERAT